MLCDICQVSYAGCICREYVELGARYTALSASSEVKLKEGQIAVQKAREELAAAQEQHEKAVADACAAREASLATARAERNSALNELKAKHAAESSGVEVQTALATVFGDYFSQLCECLVLVGEMQVESCAFGASSCLSFWVLLMWSVTCGENSPSMAYETVQNELRKRLEHAESRHAEALAEKEQLLLSAQAEAVSSTAAAQEKVSTELQKHNTEIARLEKEAEKRITGTLSHSP